MLDHHHLDDFTQTDHTHTDTHILPWSISASPLSVSPEGVTGTWHVTLILNIAVGVDKWLITCFRHSCLCFNYPVTSQGYSITLCGHWKLSDEAHCSWLSSLNRRTDFFFLVTHTSYEMVVLLSRNHLCPILALSLSACLLTGLLTK